MRNIDEYRFCRTPVIDGRRLREIEALGLPDDVWATAEGHRTRPLRLLGVDDKWSAFRLRHAR